MNKKIMIISVLLLIVIICWKYFCTSNDKTTLIYNSIIQEELSFNQKYKAVKFTRDLGATTGISYHLTILDSDGYLKDSAGNIYISECDFEFKWSKNTLVINEDSSAKVYKKEETYKNITILYE